MLTEVGSSRQLPFSIVVTSQSRRCHGFDLGAQRLTTDPPGVPACHVAQLQFAEKAQEVESPFRLKAAKTAFARYTRSFPESSRFVT